MTVVQEPVNRITLTPQDAGVALGMTRSTRKPEETALMLGIGRNYVYELIRTGQLRSIRVGRKILIPLAAIDDFLNGTGSTK